MRLVKVTRRQLGELSQGEVTRLRKEASVVVKVKGDSCEIAKCRYDDVVKEQYPTDVMLVITEDSFTSPWPEASEVDAILNKLNKTQKEDNDGTQSGN